MPLMKRHVGFVWGLTVVLGLWQPIGLAQEPAGVPLSFSTPQATAGKSDYFKYCASCHGPDLRGIHLAPSLIEGRFDWTWRGKSIDVLAFHLRRMPPKTVAKPGSLSNEIYTNILAHILKSNGIAPGAAKLPSDLKALAKITIPKLSGTRFDPTVPVTKSAEQIARLNDLPPVTEEMLRDPSPNDWLQWGRTYQGQSYSPLKQINKENVKNLKPAWRVPLLSGENMAMPLVYQGIMYLHTFPDTVLAMDASSGAVLWRYQRQGVLGAKKMGLALYGDRVFVPTSDLHVIALNARTGEPVWDHRISTGASPSKRRGVYLRSAPLVVKGKVLQGVAAHRTPQGAFIVAIDLESGEEAWRFNTVARPGEPGGNSWNDLPLDRRNGGSVWHQGTYDAELNLVYFGVAPTYDTGPLLQRVDKEGITNDALYTNCTIALNPDTGELVWHYQHMQNDQWDLDWVFERQIVEIPVDGKLRKVVMNVGKMVMLEALDAATGEYLFTLDPGVQNVISAVDPKTGAKTFNPERIPNAKTPCVICPSAFGARSWPQTSYSPLTKLAYVPIAEWCLGMSTTSNRRELLSTGVRLSSVPHPAVDDGMMGRLQAFDVANQRLAWTSDQVTPPSTGLLATAGGLLFSGDIDPSLRALDDETGKLLWQAPLDDTPSSSLVTYSIKDRQYIAVVVGMTNNFARDITNANNHFHSLKGHSSTKSSPGGRGGAAIWAFALDDFVRNWTVEDLAPSLDQLNRGRSFAKGKQLFEAASCKACHRLRGQGAEIGPDLNQMSQKIKSGKVDRLGFLTEIVQPSKVIDEKFRTQIISTLQGKLVSGVVVHEDDKVVRLLSSPLDQGAKPKEVAKEEIDERIESNLSLMPLGLLNTLTKAEILDLLAYLESGGDPADRAFRK